MVEESEGAEDETGFEDEDVTRVEDETAAEQTAAEEEEASDKPEEGIRAEDEVGDLAPTTDGSREPPGVVFLEIVGEKAGELEQVFAAILFVKSKGRGVVELPFTEPAFKELALIEKKDSIILLSLI